MKNTFKRTIVFILVLCMATAFCLTLAACNNTEDREGSLYVGLECAYAPFNYTQMNNSNGAVKIKNADGYANGYDVMIAKKIAQELGKKLVLFKYDFDALIPAVKAGSLDLIIAGMSPLSDRAVDIDFSDAYYESDLVVVVRKDNTFLSHATSLDDFSGATLVAQAGTFHDIALQEQGPAKGIIRHTPMKDFPEMINALNARAVDGYIAEKPGALENCASNDAFIYVPLVNNVTGFSATHEDVQIAVGLKKGSELTVKINAVLAKISDGSRRAMMSEAIFLASGTNITL